MKKVDLYHLIQTALHCIHISSWELLGLREMVKPSFMLFMNGCWQSLSVTCRADRGGKRGSYWYSNTICCLDGFDRTVWAVVTHLWVSNLARFRWRCVYADTSQKLSGTSFSKWECLVAATLVNISIGLVREDLLGNVAGRKIFSAFWAWPRGVGDLHWLSQTSVHCAVSHMRKERSCRLKSVSYYGHSGLGTTRDGRALEGLHCCCQCFLLGVGNSSVVPHPV